MQYKAIVKKANIATLEETMLWKDEFITAENTDVKEKY